jgi:predicted nucleic-acid-binding protein
VIAVDTNVIVRLLTDDEPRQTERVKRLFEAETIFLPKTMVLESEWVLRRLYRLKPAAINRALEGLLSRPNVRCENEPLLRQALAWNRQGMDFADAMHLASSPNASRFATFDLRMIKSAATMGLAVSEP